MAPSYAHPTALVESESIGNGTRIWAYAHIMPGVQVGAECNICDHVFIESGVVVGNNVTLKNQVSLWEGITVHDDVFIGPNATFVNDLKPRSARMKEVRERYAEKKNWLERTVLEHGCSVGANATILGGLRLGRYCLIAAGATVTRDVEPFALMVGSPARRVGSVCVCGERLDDDVTSSKCRTCEHRH